MTIRASYERHPDLGCEAVVFIDDESMACFQIQRDLVGGERSGEYCVTTGASAPIYGGITQWRRIDDRLEFALTRRAARLFGGDDVLSFEIAPAGGDTVDEIAEHVERLLR